MLQTTILITHVFVAAALIALVLLQRGKGAEAGAAFGAGASGTVFGARGSANFLSRTTAVLAALFFATSITLAFLAGQPTEESSLIEEMAPAGGQEEITLPDLDVPAAGEDTGLPALPAETAEEGAEAPETGSDQ